MGFALRKLFTRSDNPSADSSDNPELITSRAQIERLLDKLAQGYITASVQLPGSDSPFNSAVLSVRARQGYILLDELTPAEGHQIIRQGTKIRISARLNGVEISFRSRVKAIDAGANIAAYQVLFPRQVHYLERRHNYRVPMNTGHSISFHTKRAGTRRGLTGHLVDLSSGGCCATLDYFANIPQGEFLPSCSFHLPDGEHVYFALEVRNSRRLTQSDQLRIGGRIRINDPRSQRSLERIVRRLEREHRKRLSEA